MVLVQIRYSKNPPIEPEPSRRFDLLFTEGSGIQGTTHPTLVSTLCLMPENFTCQGKVLDVNEGKVISIALRY